MKGSRMADEYGQAEETELSYEEALTLKEEIRKRGERGRLESVNGNRKLISCRQVKFDQFHIHSESAVSAGTRPRSRFLSR
jgi:hypothetical protein